MLLPASVTVRVRCCVVLCAVLLTVLWTVLYSCRKSDKKSLVLAMEGGFTAVLKRLLRRDALSVPAFMGGGGEEGGGGCCLVIAPALRFFNNFFNSPAPIGTI